MIIDKMYSKLNKKYSIRRICDQNVTKILSVSILSLELKDIFN